VGWFFMAGRTKKKSAPRTGVAAILAFLVIVLLGLAGYWAFHRSLSRLPASPADKVHAEHSTGETNEIVEVDIDKATDHLLKGNEHLSAANFAEAVREFELSAKYNPEDEDVYYNLALALAAKGDGTFP
jgi:tetratricopeptide (TPR) repeat protein